MNAIKAAIPAAIFALLAPSHDPGLELHSTDEAGLAEWEAKVPPEKLKWLDEIDKKAREREAARQRRGLQPGASPADDEPEQAPTGRPVARNPGDPPNLTDLLQAAEEEKLRAPRDIANHVAVVKAPGVLALTESFIYQVYCNGNPADGDTSTQLAAMRQRLARPRGWGDFPTVQIGILPPNDRPDSGVLGTWNAPGEIRLKPGRGENIRVLSHEFRHHNDGVWAGPMDGNGWPPRQTASGNSAEEAYAYDQMAKELGGPDYVHCQPRPLASPYKS